MKKTINAFDLKDLKEEMKKEGIKYLTDFNNSAVKAVSYTHLTLPTKRIV